MQPIPMKLNRFRWTTPSYTSQFVLENHCAWISEPMMLPKIDSTTDQPIQ